MLHRMVYLSSLVEPQSHEVLEGPRDAVLDCFARIENDERHRGSVVLTSEPVAQREFEDWDMAFAPFDDLHPDNRQNFIDLHDLRHSGKLERMKGDKKLEILVGTFLGGFRDLAFS